jgi:hypothetical protein
MPKLYLGEALGLLGKTLPFVWVRLGSYLLLFAGLAVYFAIVGGLAWLLGQLWAPLGWIVFLLAIGGGFGLVRWVTRYYFYLLKAAHTAVMTEFIVHGQAPAANQLAYGKQQVTDRFRDTSIMFAVDVLVDGAVKAFVRTFASIAGLLPIPGLDALKNLLERVAVASTTFVDEAVLSRAYAQREQNVWAVARDGVILYAQAWKPILANAVALTLIGYVEYVVFLIILALPALAIGATWPAAGPVLAILVFVGAWMLKLALADAYALAATLIAYHRETANLTPNAEWQAKLEGASEKFRELGRKAVEAVRTPGAGATPPEPPATPPVEATPPLTRQPAEPAVPPVPAAVAPPASTVEPDDGPADDLGRERT